MKIFIACSKHFYPRILPIQTELESYDHQITLPNSYDHPLMEEEVRLMGQDKLIKWKADMLRKDKENIMPNDALLALNFQKNLMPNYIGGATFLEIYRAWEMNKKLFLLNPIPDSILKDELIGMDPIILNGNLRLIR
jgi:hypothetical protein